MSRCIDANALRFDKYYDIDETGTQMPVMAVTKDEVENAPAVDVAEVVKCKDCVFSEVDFGGKRYCNGALGQVTYLLVFDDDYCSCGSRKETE